MINLRTLYTVVRDQNYWICISFRNYIRDTRTRTVETKELCKKYHCVIIRILVIYYPNHHPALTGLEEKKNIFYSEPICKCSKCFTREIFYDI